MYLSIWPIKAHITRQYPRETNEPRFWCSRLGNSLWLRAGPVIVVVSKA